MTLNSMTGFASASGDAHGACWTWELKSVNGRGLDVRLRLPSGSEPIEAMVRPHLTAAFSRGNIAAHLNIDMSASAQSVRIDHDALNTMLSAAEDLRKTTGGPPTRVELLLGLKGVLVAADDDVEPATVAKRQEAIAATCREAITALQASRAHEGAALYGILSTLVDDIGAVAQRIANHPARAPEAQLAKLNAAIDRLKETSANLDPDRLHQEAILLATRADIEEEVQRLKAHVAAARELIDGTGAVGRKLDFLAQEFNREANTICSKSHDADLTARGLELKALIERFREQVQNVE